MGHNVVGLISWVNPVLLNVWLLTTQNLLCGIFGGVLSIITCACELVNMLLELHHILIGVRLGVMKQMALKKALELVELLLDGIP